MVLKIEVVSTIVVFRTAGALLPVLSLRFPQQLFRRWLAPFTDLIGSILYWFVCLYGYHCSNIISVTSDNDELSLFSWSSFYGEGHCVTTLVLVLYVHISLREFKQPCWHVHISFFILFISDSNLVGFKI